MEQNPIGLNGMEFIEYTGPKASYFEDLFSRMGFTEIARHKSKNIKLYRQGDINFFLNAESGSFAESFHQQHGPSICSTGFRVENAQKAFETAIKRGARAFSGDESAKSLPFQAIYGIGDSLIYFIDSDHQQKLYSEEFEYTTEDTQPRGNGFLSIDHLTNNVPQGEMQKWCDWYEKVFNFRETRFFDIKGDKTGLISKVMRSPCQKITIPINEPTDQKSQIQEYIDEYHGSGIQHVALLTEDICSTVGSLRNRELNFLEVPDTYYEMLPERLPNVTEDLSILNKLRILADGDQEGYLLQIFTQNLIGPIFYEVIQRKNHFGFGEGNFQALFDAIERDQVRRGVL